MALFRDERFSRTENLLGSENLEKLKNSRVIIFGVGGVGGYAAEAIARAGVSNIDLVDNDTVSITNINRQIIALSSTVGRSKTEVMKERILDINPEANVVSHDMFFSADTVNEFDFDSYDFVIDAIDTVSSKLLLIEICNEKNIPIICSMGTGNKLDPQKFEVSDIYNTSGCPLARVMRRELKKRGIRKLNVVYSPEEPKKIFVEDDTTVKRGIPGTVSFVPPISGLLMAGYVINELIN